MRAAGPVPPRFVGTAALALMALALLRPAPALAEVDAAPPAHASAPARAQAHAPSATASAPMAAAAAAPEATDGSAPPAELHDPMDTLRRRLAARLDAVKAPTPAGEPTVRVVGHGTADKPAKAVDATGAGVKHPAPRAVRSPDRHTLIVASSGALQPRPGWRTAPTSAPASTLTAPWTYEGEGGPESWSRIQSGFATCANGKRQSPIDIRDGIKVELDPVQFDYRPSAFKVVDDGHTVEVGVAAGNSIEVQGRRYDLVGVDFHRPSEVRVNGRLFDMEAHLVHKDVDGHTAIVAVLLDRGAAQPLVQAIWNNLPLEKGMEVNARLPLDLSLLLPPDRSYYTYMGSLTAPPCSEGVLWMVMKTPVPISPEQIAIFSRLYPMNARPLQAAFGRLIKESN